MKIYTILRTRNEAKNIERFIHCYINAGVDKILIADGGSTDGTVALARGFYKVEVRDFPERVQGRNGLWRNPEGRHIQYLQDWALLNAVWGIDFENNSTVVETYISYLRKKLHRDGFEGIKTVRGVGFQIVERG